MADEYELPRLEAPPDSDEEDAGKMEVKGKCDEGDENEEHTEIIFEEGGFDDEDEERPITPFVPWIKIKQMEESFLITTMVHKEVALTSNLFRIMEEERLDIVFENQCRTKTKVSHTLQVSICVILCIALISTSLFAKLEIWEMGFWYVVPF